MPPSSDPQPTPGWSSIASTPGFACPITGAQTLDPLLGQYKAPTPSQQLLQTGVNMRCYLESLAGRDAATTGAPAAKQRQGIPPEIQSFTAEIFLVLVCSIGLMLFSFFLGDMLAPQEQLREALGITTSELPWVVGSFNTANGLSVIVSGSLTDLIPPKGPIVCAFGWLAIWNIVGAFSLQPSRYVLFFVVRAMQGLVTGVLVSGSMSILGRIYAPGVRKNRVFSAMAAAAPLGFSLGALQGGALSAHLEWIFGTNAILCAFCGAAAYLAFALFNPQQIKPALSLPRFVNSTILAVPVPRVTLSVLFGLTQGPVAAWSPYTYTLIIIGILLLIALFFWERSVKTRPLIPHHLWRTPGFTPLMIAYFLGFGSFFGVWQFYAIQFWLRIQNATPVAVALYHIPNALVGIFATWVVSRTLHIFPGHYIYTAAMFAFTMGPVFFIPQTPNTTYWALSFPGIILVTFGPDLAFAAASIFITSSVPRSYQGSAASLLVTNQNLSSAIMISVADAIGTRLDKQPDGSIGLMGLRDIWWFAFAMQLLAAFVTVVWVRIPKQEEKDHVS
ncbi:major facilitator superfamily-domain-containing protein [Aspergillus crustosus]